VIDKKTRPFYPDPAQIIGEGLRARTSRRPSWTGPERYLGAVMVAVPRSARRGDNHLHQILGRGPDGRGHEHRCHWPEGALSIYDRLKSITRAYRASFDYEECWTTPRGTGEGGHSWSTGDEKGGMPCRSRSPGVRAPAGAAATPERGCQEESAASSSEKHRHPGRDRRPDTPAPTNQPLSARDVTGQCYGGDIQPAKSANASLEEASRKAKRR